jgi:hypothetical protein
MVDKFCPKGVKQISSEAVNVVVCTTCNTVVAEDTGKPLDFVLSALAVGSHVNHPTTNLTKGIKHEIVTANLSTNTCRPGLRPDNKPTV